VIEQKRTARNLFSTEHAEYAFGELDQDGRKAIESFAEQHRSAINFMPVEARGLFRARSDRAIRGLMRATDLCGK
jgi:hypothetical protein